MPTRPLLADATKAETPSVSISVPVRLIGAIVFVLVAAAFAALASWSVDDPSLSYATSQPAKNWLGVPGAVVADLSFQLLGLGVIAMLLPPAIWSWSLLRRRV